MQQLEEGMGRLASVSAEVEASLAEVQAALNEERTRQQQFQVKVIPVWCKPGSAQIRVEHVHLIRIRIQNLN